MRRETTTSRVAARPTPSLPITLLVGSIYGMAGGLALALAIVGGLLPEAWAAGLAPGPLAFQGLLAGLGALVGIVLSWLKVQRV